MVREVREMRGERRQKREDIGEKGAETGRKREERWMLSEKREETI